MYLESGDSGIQGPSVGTRGFGMNAEDVGMVLSKA